MVRTRLVHTSGTFLEKCSNISLNHVPIYSQIQKIRIPSSTNQFIIQNTLNMPKYIRIHPFVSNMLENKQLTETTNTYSYFVIYINSIIRLKNVCFIYIDIYIYIYIYIFCTFSIFGSGYLVGISCGSPSTVDLVPLAPPGSTLVPPKEPFRTSTCPPREIPV